MKENNNNNNEEEEEIFERPLVPICDVLNEGRIDEVRRDELNDSRTRRNAYEKGERVEEGTKEKEQAQDGRGKHQN